MDEHTISELREISNQARAALDGLLAAADGEVAAEDAYRRLRMRAATLNADERWASAEEFDTLLPTLEVRREMAALDRWLRGSSHGPSSPAVGELLVALWGWSRGVLIAYRADG